MKSNTDSTSRAAAVLGSITTEAKATAARENGQLGGRPRTLRVSAEEARTIIPGLIAAGEFYEASWVTGRHFADPDYEVGDYVTCESSGDYTDHPQYSGVNTDHRPDDMPVAEWVVSCLPKSGQVVIRVKANRA